ncbi:MAG TPA: hypothetical protein ENM98_00880 [Halothiobacillaceae bacterium]|nr:hypothetical protein [Halothiobacillaceae bacterium]
MGPLSVEVVRIAAQMLAQSPGGNRERILKKAAHQCGQQPDNRLLSQDLERLEKALAQYHLTFNPDQQKAAIAACDAALQAMDFFESYRPMAVGAVITGTINQNELIQLHLFADTPELVIEQLLKHKIPFEEDERQFVRADSRQIRVPLFRFIADDWPFELAVFQPDEIRQPPLQHNRPIKRMNQNQLQRHLQALKDEKAISKEHDHG